MKKRGIAHTEIILAFVIFITAVLLALYFFNPMKGGREVNTYLTYSFTEILEETNIRLVVYSVNLNGDLIAEDDIAIRIPGISGNTYVETYDGVMLNSYRGGDFVNIARGSNSWNSIDFLEIRVSEDIDPMAVISGTENSDYYEISTSYEKDVVSEKKFKALVDRHNSDYEGLREEFNLKIGISFSLVSDSVEITAEKEVPAGLEVFADRKIVEVLKEDGTIEFADLNVKVW